LARAVEDLDYHAAWIEDEDVAGDVRSVAAELNGLKLEVERETLCAAGGQS
jgi:hypothetical protein